MGRTAPQSVDGLWPKEVPEGKQVNGFTGELEDAPADDKSPSPLEQRLAAAQWDIRVDGGGDQFTKVDSLSFASGNTEQDEEEEDDVSIPTPGEGSSQTV